MTAQSAPPLQSYKTYANQTHRDTKKAVKKFTAHAFLFVGVTRLELATSRPPDAYSNQLSYTPIISEKRCKGKQLFRIMQINLL